MDTKKSRVTSSSSARISTDGMTYQAIAQASGVDAMTVHKSVIENSITQPATVKGKDGKSYPSKKPRKARDAAAAAFGTSARYEGSP